MLFYKLDPFSCKWQYHWLNHLQFVYIVMVIAVRPHLIAPNFTWSDSGDLGQESQTTVTSDVIQQLNSRVQVLEQGEVKF